MAADAAFTTMSDAVLAVAAELSLAPALAALVKAARRLAGARYAAIGVPDADGDAFAQFLTDGMTEGQIAAIGPLPRQHGLLAAMLTQPAPFRTRDITTDPRFKWWPPTHPRMRSFLGVPIVSKGTVVGAFYLTDKEHAPGFSAADQRRIELLAAHAAIAIDNARLFELTRELSIAQERTRLARELHDAINQTLFSLTLVAEAGDLASVKQLARAALAELRTVIMGLYPPDLAADGLPAALDHHIDLLRHAHRADIELTVHGRDRRLSPDREREVLRVAQEALSNALRHASAGRVTVELSLGDAVTLVVRDDGAGFDPTARTVRARHLGLTSMRERARRLGGHLRIDSAPGAGTAVILDCPGEGTAPAAPVGADPSGG
ncbi:MAG: GAF domain-containing sensor histidine kinase [Egibacteraceae bacterium]